MEGGFDGRFSGANDDLEEPPEGGHGAARVRRCRREVDGVVGGAAGPGGGQYTKRRILYAKAQQARPRRASV